MKEKRVLVASLVLIIVGLFFILNFQGNITGAAIGASGALNSGSNLLFGLFLVWIAGILLIGSADLSLEERIEKKNIKKNSEVLDINKLVAVRIVKNGELNKDGKTLYGSPARPTIHFILNGLPPPVNAGITSWDSGDIAILTPVVDLIKYNKNNFYGGYTKDIFCVGYVKIPNCTIVKRKEEENNKDFKERVNNKIKEMGFEIFPEKNDDIHEEQFKNLLKKLKKDGSGDYSNIAHGGSIFDQVESFIGNNVFGGLAGVKTVPNPNYKFLKNNIKRYILEKSEELKLYDIIKKEKDNTLKFPSIDEFYKEAKKNLKNKKFENYESWFKRNLEGNNKLIMGPMKVEKVNNDFYRTLYRDSLESGVGEIEIGTIEKIKEKSTKKEPTIKYVYGRKVILEPLDVNQNEIEDLKNKLHEINNCLARFSGPIDAWKAHWREKEKGGNKDYKN